MPPQLYFYHRHMSILTDTPEGCSSILIWQRSAMYTYIVCRQSSNAMEHTHGRYPVSRLTCIRTHAQAVELIHAVGSHI